VTWHDSIPNVADYDAVFVDLTPLDHEYDLPNPTYYPSLPIRDSFAKLLESGGRVWVIAVPPVSKEWEDGATWSNYEWCPILPELCFEIGETIKDVRTPYDAYFAHLKKWSFYFEEMDKSFLYKWYHLDATMVPELSTVEIKTLPLAQNRYDKPLAIGVRYIVHEGHIFEGFPVQHDKKVPGQMYFLHPPSEISSKEAIDILLRDIFGIGTREPEPEWAAGLRVPEQDAIEKRIKEAQDIIEVEQAKIDAASTELADRRKFVELLYQKSERLQELVWETLEDMGATVTRPTVENKNKEDGWISTPFGEGVLEIKSSKGSASFDDVRQLDGWVLNGRQKGKEYKSILIGNYFCDKPLPSRRKPFPANVIKEAEKREQCLLTTQQLFEAHCTVQEGADGEAFLKEIMTTVGPCTLVERPKWSV